LLEPIRGRKRILSFGNALRYAHQLGRIIRASENAAIGKLTAASTLGCVATGQDTRNVGSLTCSTPAR